MKLFCKQKKIIYLGMDKGLSIKDIQALPSASLYQLYNFKGIVYVFLNKVNNKIYIGQSKNILFRRYNYKYEEWFKMSTNERLRRALKKNEMRDFKVSILGAFLTKMQRDQLECFYIRKFKSNDPGFGYNITKGGDGYSKNHYSGRKFLKRGVEIHGDKYNYNLVVYKGHKVRVKIVCNRCGKTFTQTPSKHTSFKAGCKACVEVDNGIRKRLTFEEFVAASRIKHGNEYTYFKEAYVKNVTKTKTLHNKCQNIFFQTPKSHKRGRGCHKCFQAPNYGRAVKSTNLLSGVTETFESASRAAKELRSRGYTGISPTSISRVCNGERSYCYGFSWKYVESQHTDLMLKLFYEPLSR